MTREQMWARLGERPVDLLVIGGGITGAGIARDAARRGLSVALVEMRDLASGTSSRSSKLVHGGLRYLEQYEFSLVFESVSERRILMDIAPHLVNPLGFLFPVYTHSRHGLWLINTGMLVYEGLSLFRSPKLHRRLKPADVAREEPALDRTELTGAPLYYDCSTDDARLTLETAIDATRAGATVVTWAKVTSFLYAQGRVTGAVVQDGVSGATKEVRASAVINATGPWTDGTLRLAGAGTGALLRPTKGVHLVVERAKLPANHAVVTTHPTDGRVLFVIPWGEHTYVGTTDTDYKGDPSEVAATRADVDYLLAVCRHYFPGYPLVPDDVISTWAGLRPLMAPPSGAAVAESQVSREHQIVVGRDGLVTVAGGKLTTYRRMAAEVVDTAVNVLRLAQRLPSELKPAKTEESPLPGAVGWPEDDDPAPVVARIQRASGLPPATCELLAATYGVRGEEVAALAKADPALAAPLVPGRPEILAQVDFAVKHELAARLEDVLARRTQIVYRDRDQGLGCAGVVAERMAALLGWDEARVAEELARYEREVTLTRRWRQE